MTTTFPSDQFVSELMFLLTETFESVHGVYLDRGTSLLETLAGISAEEASIPVGGKCATIAAQVTHVCFYLDVMDRFMRSGQDEPTDWGEVWRTVSGVWPANRFTIMLSWFGSRCWIRMKAMPLPAGSAPTSFRLASRPPAEAPMPTTGKPEGVRTRPLSVTGCRIDRTRAALARCGRLFGILG